MNRFVYPANLIPNEEDGRFVVTFPDIEGAKPRHQKKKAAHGAGLSVVRC